MNTQKLKITAPGRTEVGGNHTDHQHGNVLAAAIDLEVQLICEKTTNTLIEIETDEFGLVSLDISSSLEPNENDSDSAALIRGVAAFLEQNGYKTGAFTGTLTSNVLVGSGLSSSAAFENAIGGAFSHLFNNGSIPLNIIARAGQYAENVYLNKGSGLMDQTASAYGGFVQIDFNDPTNPIIRPISFDFTASGYTLFITDTKGSHAGLDASYSAMPSEMKQVAAFFNKEVLNDVDEAEFWVALPKLHGTVSDRAILRAGHYFAETKRAVFEANALENGDIQQFLKLVRESGQSSLSFLQNVWDKTENQEITLGLLLSQQILQEVGSEPLGAWRVHGGGLAGTIQAFVANEKAEEYREKMDAFFGDGSCQMLKIRSEGITCESAQ